MAAIETITGGVSGFFKASVYPIVFAILTFTGLSAPAVSLLAILLLADFVTAIIREWVIDPTRIKSRKAIIGLISKSLVFAVPFLLASVAKVVGAQYNLIIFADVVLTLLIVSEGYSIIGNIIQIREKDSTITEYDAITATMRFIQHTFKAVIEKIFPNNNPTNDNRND